LTNDANFQSSPLGKFTAISLMHESGTGGEPKYGVVAQTPLVGDLKAQGINVANNWTYLVRLLFKKIIVNLLEQWSNRFPVSAIPQWLATGHPPSRMVSNWS
jgi:hypothetical protein